MLKLAKGNLNFKLKHPIKMEKFEELKTLIASLEGDADKFYNKANSAAGTRIRKGMQDLKMLLRLYARKYKN